MVGSDGRAFRCRAAFLVCVSLSVLTANVGRTSGQRVHRPKYEYLDEPDVCCASRPPAGGDATFGPYGVCDDGSRRVCCGAGLCNVDCCNCQNGCLVDPMAAPTTEPVTGHFHYNERDSPMYVWPTTTSAEVDDTTPYDLDYFGY